MYRKFSDCVSILLCFRLLHVNNNFTRCQYYFLKNLVTFIQIQCSSDESYLRKCITDRFLIKVKKKE